MNYNQLTLVGNLTRDPVRRALPSGTMLTEGGIAVNRPYKVNGEKREDTVFMDFSDFGEGGEAMVKYCRKGDPILLAGRIKMDTWTDKATGQQRTKHSMVVDRFVILTRKGDNVEQRQQLPISNPEALPPSEQAYDPLRDNPF